MYQTSYQQGLTLIELLITITLGLMILGILLDIYLVSQRSYRWQLALAHLQTEIRIAIDHFNQDISNAGYLGCAHLSKDFPIQSYSIYSLTPQNKLQIHSANEISSRHAALSHAVLIKPMTNAQLLLASTHPAFSVGDVMIISDCAKAEIFAIANVYHTKDSQQIYPRAPLHYSFKQNADLARLEINTYFIAKIAKKTGPVYALFVKDIKNRKTKIVEGVEAMNVLYTIKEQQYYKDVPANEVPDVSQILGVSIKLNVSSNFIHKIVYDYVRVK